eukprot:TRINITY_DN894_c0_g1_i1.p1 TRINITY_DN894_c0_g1~~TRINITY_DN894_c0_g1_i1.p1  ORF type:complete len:446 (-),score=73.43 TRINITY_DN894_c0_g1_i1:23-1297(-)
METMGMRPSGLGGCFSLLLVVLISSGSLCSASRQPLREGCEFYACRKTGPKLLSLLEIHLPKLEAGGHFGLLTAIRDPTSSFSRFCARFGKNYTSAAERLHRLRVFEQNLIVAVENQINDPSAVHGVTQFSDLTEDEFASNFLGLRRPPLLKRIAEGSPLAPPLPVNDLPPEFDWRDKGAVTPVKSQGMCGSCYSFSTVGAVESAHFLETGELVSLSEQQIVDCDHQCDETYGEPVCDSGCDGGLMTNAFQYIMGVGGLEGEETYPYKGVDGKCKFDPSRIRAKVPAFSVVDKNEEQMAANLVTHGPLAIGINAAWMQTYIRGVSCPLVCNKRGLDHGVLIVGYGESEFSIARLKSLPYWIIKNSWGPHWGEKGYYKVCRGKEECGLDSMVSEVLAAAASGKEKGQGGGVLDMAASSSSLFSTK